MISLQELSLLLEEISKEYDFGFVPGKADIIVNKSINMLKEIANDPDSVSVDNVIRMAFIQGFETAHQLSDLGRTAL